MRQELIELLVRFEQRAITAEELRSRIYAMFKGGIEKTLSRQEAAKLNNFFAWYLDMFNPEQQPRTGIFGRIKDRFAQIFRGEYRVGEASLRTKAAELHKVLLSGTPIS